MNDRDTRELGTSQHIPNLALDVVFLCSGGVE